MKTPLTLSVLVAVAVLTASCGGSSDDAAGNASAASSGGASPAAAQKQPDPVAGRWQSDTVTPKQVMRNLRGAGLAQAARTVIADQGYPNSFTLVLSSGQYRLTTKVGDVVDIGSYELSGHRIHLVAAETGHGPTLRWTRDGDALDLVFLESDGTPYMGIPDEAFARPLYDVPVYHAAG